MGCDNCTKPTPTPQHAVRFKAWYAGGVEFEGTWSDWALLPDDGVLAVKVWFNDGGSRNCAGADWYGAALFPDGHWSIIHNQREHAENVARYPTVAWKAGRWTSEAEIQAVIAAMGV